MDVEILTSLADLKRVVGNLQRTNRTIGVVPTMGALHAGHLSLVTESLRENDETIVTVFVNPTQFAPTEDLDQYPQSLQSDVAELNSIGVKYVFAPQRDEVYPVGFSTGIDPPAVARRLEGEFRPTHFAGVATIVLKLLNLTQADRAYFGQKDYQQTMVVSQMVRDFNVPTEIRVCPIIRDADGLAMSSRNAYLSKQDRHVARSLNQTLDDVEQQIQAGQRDGFEIITEMRQRLIDAGVERIDYAIVTHPESLEMADPIELPVVALVAAHVGQTRLIDNRIIQ